MAEDRYEGRYGENVRALDNFKDSHYFREVLIPRKDGEWTARNRDPLKMPRIPFLLAVAMNGKAHGIICYDDENSNFSYVDMTSQRAHEKDQNSLCRLFC